MIHAASPAERSPVQTDTPLNVSALKVSCANCSMHQLCLPMGLEDADIDRLDPRLKKSR